MAYLVPDFFSRRALLAGGIAALATPALANVGPDLFKGTVSRFVKAATPKPLPALEFTDVEDKKLTFADFQGKVLLVNLWATWCPPCIAEMPSLDRLQAATDKDKFLVLPLSLDGPSRPKVVPFYKDKKLAHLGIYFDKARKAMAALDVSLLPTSILVDAQGREIGRMEGEAHWDKPEAIALIKAAVGG
jgi:thiol-disulfide isomerase/thioredoxin